MAFYFKKPNQQASSRSELKKPSGVNLYSGRIYILIGFIFFASLAIIGKLCYLQISQHTLYKALAANQHSVWKHLVPNRGEIFLSDRNSLYPAAVNQETKMAFAVPKEVENSQETARIVSEILGLDAGAVAEKLSNREDMYEVLKHRLTDEEIDRIKTAKLKGIHLSDQAYRYYPAGELAAHILGFVGWKDEEFGGRYGSEIFFEDRLKGESGSIFQNKDASGKWVTTGLKEIVEAKDGDNIIMTIDHIIQYETEKILRGAIIKHQADRGTIIVMEPNTGRILSMASYPTFNPNEYAKVENMEAFRNIAVSDAYESGSVFKTITMAAAIDSGRVNPDTTYVDTGVVKEAGYEIKNSDYKAYGKQTMTQVLENSLNTGVIYAEKLMGNRNFSDYVRRFGFGESTGANIYGEAKGTINNLKNLKSDIQFFTASFGQGITVTPLQLVNAYGAIANGGTLMKPQIVQKVIHSDGSEEEIAPQEVRRVISPQASRLVSQMLRNVVVNGHGKRAGVPGYLVGGKTGTAQVASTESKGYEEGKNIGTFCGYAPTDNPKYVAIVRIDNPKNVEWAESSAAPAFGELMKFLLEYGRIEPTEEYDQKDMEEFNTAHDLKSYANRDPEEVKEEEERKKSEQANGEDSGNEDKDKKKKNN